MDDWAIGSAPIISTNRTNPSEPKPDMDLFPPEAMFEIAAVFTFGRTKHGAHDWRNSRIPWGTLMSKALRHCFAWLGGDDLDPESGHSHLAHACCDLMMLIGYIRNRDQARYKTLDDRWKDGKIDDLRQLEIPKPPSAVER